MKFIFLFTLAILAVASTGGKVSASGKVCFSKEQKCCYKFKVGDSTVKSMKCYKPCQVKKCEKKCKDVCKPVCKKVPKTTVEKVCEMKSYYKTPKHCHHKKPSGKDDDDDDDDKDDDDDDDDKKHKKHHKKPKCAPVLCKKKVCHDKKVTKYVNSCVNKCEPCCKQECALVTVYKIIIKKTKVTTYVPKLSCGPIKVVGHAIAPKDYTSKKDLGTVVGAKVYKKPHCTKC